MLWGKPMWGAYWVWDPRLTAELVLLFLYLGYMGLRAGIEDPGKADKASAVLAVVGVVNVPIIKFSVEWWNSLHQSATVMQLGKPKLDFDGLWPLLLMFVAFALYFVAVLLIRLRAELLRRERNAAWVREVLS
jgi:heme exporter protein C